MIELLNNPWPWYVAGPIIGLTVPLLLLLLNESFGISSTLRDFCAMCMPNTKITFFQYDWKSRMWALTFILGVGLGAFVVAQFFPNLEAPDIHGDTLARLHSYGITTSQQLLPSEIFSWEHLTSPRTIIMLCLGGFLVGFGTRYAGGCTSGHAIMGLSMMKLASLVAVIGFFVGGLIMTWFVLPFILSL
ncbi:YeeE/YedE family protein [Bacteroidia bacterium]|nr:YeeE/YedE family protein [Bacteroidia bacterium]